MLLDFDLGLPLLLSTLFLIWHGSAESIAWIELTMPLIDYETKDFETLFAVLVIFYLLTVFGFYCNAMSSFLATGTAVVGVTETLLPPFCYGVLLQGLAFKFYKVLNEALFRAEDLD